jgi:hypothetical protein
MPFLCRAFPRDQEVEVLRSNMRTVAKGAAGGSATDMTWEPANGVEEMLKEPGEKEETTTFSGLNWGADRREEQDGRAEEEGTAGSKIAPFVPAAMEIDTPFVTGAFAKTAVAAEDVVTAGVVTAEQTPMSPLKRKGDELDSGKAKKLDAEPLKVDDEEGESDSDEGSIQIDMTMDDDEEEDEEDGEENTGGD